MVLPETLCRVPELLFIMLIFSGLPGGFRFFFGGGGLGTFGVEHSVEDHYLHINGILFLRGSSQFLFFWGGGGDPRPPQNSPPGSPGLYRLKQFLGSGLSFKTRARTGV